MPGKYRSGCSQSFSGESIWSLMKELETVPKELKGFAAHRRNNNMNKPVPLELPGTKPPIKENTWWTGGSRCICSRGWPSQSSMGGEDLGPVSAVFSSVGNARARTHMWVGW